MGIFHRISRTIACAALALVFATPGTAVVAAAQTQGSCPAIIASLLPKNVSGCNGQYLAGPLSRGNGSADIPFEHRCIKSTKFPARISITVWHYGEDFVELFKLEGNEPDEQNIRAAMGVLEQTGHTAMREKLAGGDIAYAEYMSECPSEGGDGLPAYVGPMELPNIKLTGVTRTDNARLEVTLEGSISVEAAKAAVAEVFENLKRTDFSKVQ